MGCRTPWDGGPCGMQVPTGCRSSQDTGPHGMRVPTGCGFLWDGGPCGMQFPTGCASPWDAGPHATASQQHLSVIPAPAQLPGYIPVRPALQNSFWGDLSHLPLTGCIPWWGASIPGHPHAHLPSPGLCPVSVIPAVFAISLLPITQLCPVPAGRPFSSLGGWHAGSRPSATNLSAFCPLSSQSDRSAFYFPFQLLHKHPPLLPFPWEVLLGSFLLPPPRPLCSPSCWGATHVGQGHGARPCPPSMVVPSPAPMAASALGTPPAALPAHRSIFSHPGHWTL